MAGCGVVPLARMAAASEIANEKRRSVLLLLGRLVEALDFCALA
jgi:hypothetical protein